MELILNSEDVAPICAVLQGQRVPAAAKQRIWHWNKRAQTSSGVDLLHGHQPTQSPGGMFSTVAGVCSVCIGTELEVQRHGLRP